MKVILLEYVYKHGVAGEVIDVADGFARNYLIPSRRAVKATEGELKRAKRLREQAALKRAQLDDQLNELAGKIDGVELVFGRRAATTGKLFGSVTTQELAEELMKATGIDINRRRISQAQIRDIGTHLVPVRMGNEISPNLKVTVVREEELKEFLSKRAAAEKVTAEGSDVAPVAAEADEVAAEGTDSATAE